MSFKIHVDILDTTFASDDGGKTWQHYDRLSCARPTIKYLGIASENHLPHNRSDTHWDFIYLSQDGFGVAVNHEKAHEQAKAPKKRLAGLFISTNHARDWRKNPLQLNWTGRLLSRFSWPVERFDGFIATKRQTMILSWQDPWIMDQSRSHVIFSNNTGQRWHYRRLPAVNPRLYSTPGNQIMCFSNTVRCHSRDEGKHWEADAMDLRIDESGADAIYSDILHAVFVSEHRGFALLAKYGKAITMARPESIIMLETVDTGIQWRSKALFPFPSQGALGDPNTILSLSVS